MKNASAFLQKRWKIKFSLNLKFIAKFSKDVAPFVLFDKIVLEIN